MSIQLITVVALALVFLIATVLPVHMGALAFVAAFVVGTAFVGEDADDIVAGFPGDLFVILVGVTLLFAIAKGNGTVDRLVQLAVRAVGGRIALIPWVMFGVTAVLTAVGAVVPAAVAIIAPIGMAFAVRHRINPMLMGLLVINGASAGGFSPMSIFGSITNGVVERNGLPGSPVLLFLASLVFNTVLSVIVFFLFGGRDLIRRSATGGNGGREDDGSIALATEPGTSVALGGGSTRPGRTRPPTGGTPAAAGPSGVGTVVTADTPATSDAPATTGPPVPDGTGEHAPLNRDHVLTIIGLVALAVGALAFGLDVGFTALTVATALSLLSPASAKAAVGQVAWPTVLLICGIVTFVALMERVGTIEWLGNLVTRIGAPLLAAIIICLIGAIVSAFASTTGILGALIPLAVPFLLAGQVGPIGMIIALALSSSVVDSSPFSTSGALVVANAPAERTDQVFRGLMIWGFSMCALVPLTTWLLFVVPGWG
ncbi:transporter, UIT1 family [Pseudonocardia ammonioxydans]|uniref:Transporter, UIT1 family n=1 Tax=Pseudonocardia ammonioxydans TaxID=260086 RepID=A0A1I5G0J2_PSUAM|nr:SLC13 family permease [Pseudonocardia ammonioxydans]SFO29498.1 transporter, UIT1 family [Pseudonocardia ammonioxydans]